MLGMLERNDWGVADLTKDCLGARLWKCVLASAVFIGLRALLTYITYLYPWDYNCSVTLERLGYQVMTLDGGKRL